MPPRNGNRKDVEGETGQEKFVKNIHYLGSPAGSSFSPVAAPSSFDHGKAGRKIAVFGDHLLSSQGNNNGQEECQTSSSKQDA